MIQTSQSRKRSFSSFNYKDAFKQLGIMEPQRWLHNPPAPISSFFEQRLARLQRFDLESKA